MEVKQKMRQKFVRYLFIHERGSNLPRVFNSSNDDKLWFNQYLIQEASSYRWIVIVDNTYWEITDKLKYYVLSTEKEFDYKVLKVLRRIRRMLKC